MKLGKNAKLANYISQTCQNVACLNIRTHSKHYHFTRRRAAAEHRCAFNHTHNRKVSFSALGSQSDTVIAVLPNGARNVLDLFLWCPSQFV
jgi:hypothetical protein